MRLKIVPTLFLLSGLTGLIYEIVWIRLFSTAFGQASQALASVLAAYLGGLALGSWFAGRIASAHLGRCLSLYGAAEMLTGLYALTMPWMIHATQPLLSATYGSGHEGACAAAALRTLLCSAILVPPTALMGASLPLLAGFSGNRGPGSIQFLYTVNLSGASIGAFLSSFVLLPAWGFSRSLQFACLLNLGVGVTAIWIARNPQQKSQAPLSDGSSSMGPARSRAAAARERTQSVREAPLATGTWIAVAFGSGVVCMLHEVAWARVYGLLLGPTASTVALVLGVFLLGLTAGSVAGRCLRRGWRGWLCAAQFGCAALLLWAFAAAGALPRVIAEWIRWHNQSAAQIELMKVLVLAATFLPLTIAIGLSFPLIMRIAPVRELPVARRIGGAYGINTAGCIAGALGTGWLLIPALGSQTTLLVGGLLNLSLGILLFSRLPRVWPALASGAGVTLAVFAAPRWDMSAMSAGGYKYAPYYASSGSPQFELEAPLFLREAVSGTVAVRQAGPSRVLSIDGKVDASDAGGDLLAEKLLAHLPLLLRATPKDVCLIGLASGVTAGGILTYPVQSLDVVEVSREVVNASHFFDGVNRKPLADPRTVLLVNDGRNHLALTSRRYDVIISEPSNPWIAGMNSLFTREFFGVAKRKLRPGGLLAQWFHIYNMPKDDLQSLLRAFVEIFPSAILWQLNDGDVLITGFADGSSRKAGEASALSPMAVSDLAGADVPDPELLLNLYVMWDGDLRRFAGSAPPNTDDNAMLEFHGQRDLQAQTDISNAGDLTTFPKLLPPPEGVRRIRDRLTAPKLVSEGSMFERAESLRMAFHSYQNAFREDPKSLRALAGMDRTARLPEQRAAVDAALGLRDSGASLQNRTERALEKARNGDLAGAQLLFEETAEAHPLDSAARLNYGLFCLERSDYAAAIAQFQQAIELNPGYLPAHEAMAEAYLRLHDLPNAAIWSRRILQLDPGHQVARQTLEAIETTRSR